MVFSQIYFYIEELDKIENQKYTRTIRKDKINKKVNKMKKRRNIVDMSPYEHQPDQSSIERLANDINIEKEERSETVTESDRMDIDELSPDEKDNKMIKQSIIASQFEGLVHHQGNDSAGSQNFEFTNNKASLNGNSEVINIKNIGKQIMLTPTGQKYDRVESKIDKDTIQRSTNYTASINNK